MVHMDDFLKFVDCLRVLDHFFF